MLYEVSDRGMDNFNRVITDHLDTSSTSYYSYRRNWKCNYGFNEVAKLKLLGFALALCATGIGYAIIHPEINLNGLSGDTAAEKEKHFENFRNAFDPIVVGYVIGAPLLYFINILSCTTKRELDFNPYEDYCGRIFWNTMFTRNKLACSIGDDNLLTLSASLLNSVATIIGYSVSTAAYGLLGAAILGKIQNLDDAQDLAVTYAIGGAVLPATAACLSWVSKVFSNGGLTCCPPEGIFELKKLQLPSFNYCKKQEPPLVTAVVLEQDLDQHTYHRLADISEIMQMGQRNVLCI